MITRIQFHPLSCLTPFGLTNVPYQQQYTEQIANSRLLLLRLFQGSGTQQRGKKKLCDALHVAQAYPESVSTFVPVFDKFILI